MLYAEDVVVADHSKVDEILAPAFLSMPPADGSKVPGPMKLIDVGFRIQGSIDTRVFHIGLAVLRVHVLDRFAQSQNSIERVDTLPLDIARVIVATDLLTHDVPELERGSGL